jgi:hypothetical protein
VKAIKVILFLSIFICPALHKFARKISAETDSSNRPQALEAIDAIGEEAHLKYAKRDALADQVIEY